MTVRILDFIIYWAVILIPFAMAIAPAPMNVFTGLLIFSFLLKKLIKAEKTSIHSSLSIPLVFFFLAAVISIFNSVNYPDSLRGLFRIIQYFLLFLVIAGQVKDKPHLKKIIISVAGAALLLSIDALWQVITGKDFIRGNAPVVNLGIKRATASFPDANVLGVYLSAVAPLVITLALYHFRRNKKIIISSLALLVLSGMAITYSRPTILAIYVAVLLLGMVKKDKILISALVIFTVIAPFMVPRSVKDWAKEVEYNPLRFMCNDDRIAIYRNTLHMIEAHPVIGVGVNTFMKNYKKYKESPEYRNVVTSDYVYAHNNFLQMAAETGVLGLGIFLWLLYRLFKSSISIYGRLKDSLLKNTSLGLVLCLVAFLVNGLTESSLYYARVALIFWYLAGLSLSMGKFINDRQS